MALDESKLQLEVFTNPVHTELKVWTNKGSVGICFTEGEFSCCCLVCFTGLLKWAYLDLIQGSAPEAVGSKFKVF